MTRTTLALVPMVVGLALGCTHHYVPKQAEVDADRIPELDAVSIRGPVAVEAAPGVEYERVVATYGSDRWMATQVSLNEMVAQHLVTELERRGVAIDASASKRLSDLGASSPRSLRCRSGWLGGAARWRRPHRAA
jgi:hypothetical protein